MERGEGVLLGVRRSRSRVDVACFIPDPLPILCEDCCSRSKLEVGTGGRVLCNLHAWFPDAQVRRTKGGLTGRMRNNKVRLCDYVAVWC